MIITYIIMLILAWIIVSLCTGLHRVCEKSPSAIMADIGDRLLVNPFSVAEYLARMERESLKLAERREQYMIVLWWGYDGLRINEDGTTEWITRKPKPVKNDIEISLDASEVACAVFDTLSTGRRLDGTIIQDASLNIESAIQAQTQVLQAQQLQVLQSIQMQNTITCIRPAPYPSYLIPQTYTPNYWTYPGGCFGTNQS